MTPDATFSSLGPPLETANKFSGLLLPVPFAPFLHERRKGERSSSGVEAMKHQKNPPHPLRGVGEWERNCCQRRKAEAHGETFCARTQVNFPCRATSLFRLRGGKKRVFSTVSRVRGKKWRRDGALLGRRSLRQKRNPPATPTGSDNQLDENFSETPT
jgi:hypothetical protein